MSDNKHQIHHLMILDRSGSMGSVKQDTIGGFNQNLVSMLQDAKEQENIDHIVSLVQFDDQYEELQWMKPVSAMNELTEETFVPRGGTALFDAIGKAITSLRENINDRLKVGSANVIVTIFTDGAENSSREYEFGAIKALLEEVQNTRLWIVTLIGCNEETLEKAGQMGISKGNTMSYQPGKIGTQQAFASYASNRSRVTRSMSKAVRTASLNDMAVQDALGQMEDKGNFFHGQTDAGEIPDAP